MIDASIRSFALDYYRKRGAEVRPLEGEAYEVRKPDGAALTLSFAPDVASDRHVLSETSPQWRAILEDLTSEVVVSYRYLVAGPIARPAETLEACLPEGWRVLKARLAGVETRPVLGITHRVSFDAVAMNARVEAMHHHVWDAKTGRRLLDIEEKLYQVPCLLMRPSKLPSEQAVEKLIEASLTVVDAESESRGTELERELQEMLQSAESRINQYYDQQMSQVIAREAQLAEKVDAIARRLAEARNPEQIARYRQDLQLVGAQLESARSRREADLAAIDAACTRKLAEEREKHELTATTDLVALCHVAYDVVSYRCSLRSPSGAEMELSLRYWPLRREVSFPSCVSCGAPSAMPLVLETGGIACAECAEACSGCAGMVAKTSLSAVGCGVCGILACQGCMNACSGCGEAHCEAHGTSCQTCEVPLCPRCAKACAECASPVCEGHAQRDPVNGRLRCEAHALAPETAITVLPFSGPPCPSCRIPSHTMKACETCGVPACESCEAAGGCAACAELRFVPESDPRLVPLLSARPRLQGRRRWALAQVGPYVVAGWRKLTGWGMVTYTVNSGAIEIVQDFHQGPWDALNEWLGLGA